MSQRAFQVEVISSQRALYYVEAPDAQTAEKLAVQRWQAGQSSDLTAFESSHLESTNATEAADATRQGQDDELLLRFIHERERLLGSMAGNFMAASVGDAVSASQAAADLGWYRGSGGDQRVPDVVRAAQALERLCARKKLICFERDRIRAGERGAIRLYCTPGYLEGLSAALAEPRPRSASA